MIHRSRKEYGYNKGYSAYVSRDRQSYRRNYHQDGYRLRKQRFRGIGRYHRNSGYYDGHSGYDRCYGGSEYYSRNQSDRPGVHFWNRNDGYSNYYGSDEEESNTATSKILSVLSGIISKAKPNAYRKPTAQSSNLTFNPAVQKGSYVSSDVVKMEKGDE